jgi:hypothetical protein
MKGGTRQIQEAGSSAAITRTMETRDGPSAQRGPPHVANLCYMPHEMRGVFRSRACTNVQSGPLL